jgi:hypothetical protein
MKSASLLVRIACTRITKGIGLKPALQKKEQAIFRPDHEN